MRRRLNNNFNARGYMHGGDALNVPDAGDLKNDFVAASAAHGVRCTGQRAHTACKTETS